MPSSLAVQFYTLREHSGTASGFAKCLRRIRDIGYPAVQLSAIGAMNGTLPEVDATETRKMLHDHDLRCIATHRPWDRLLNDLDAEIEFHQTIDCDFIAIGGINSNTHEQSYEGYETYLAETKPVLEKLSAHGLRFGYHNHAHEFHRPERCGPTLMDTLIDKSDSKLQFELDLYWVEHAGLRCERILARCHGRVPVIHLKDKEVSIQDGPRMAPIGEGNMDWERILPACRAAGVQWYAVEQDNCYRDPFDCLKSSFEFLSAKGL